MKKPGQQIHLPTSLLCDPTMEPLTPLIKPYKGITGVPSELAKGDEATMVFVELNKCFQKANMVAEGLLANIIWGFEQCGYDPRAVAAGLTKLRKQGFVRYTDSWGNEVFETNFDPKKPIHVRYTKKMIDLFIREGASTEVCATLEKI